MNYFEEKDFLFDPAGTYLSGYPDSKSNQDKYTSNKPSGKSSITCRP